MGFLSKQLINYKIKCLKNDIVKLEKKRYRFQSSLVMSMMEHSAPDDNDIDYFNRYCDKIDRWRTKIRILNEKSK